MAESISVGQLIKENLVKNVLILILLGFSYGLLSRSLLAVDLDKISDFLTIISILLVAVCFATFAFSYEYSDIADSRIRFFSHAATSVFIILIGLLLLALTLSVNFVYPSLYSSVLLFSALLYLGVIFYDFWDILRALRKVKL